MKKKPAANKGPFRDTIKAIELGSSIKRAMKELQRYHALYLIFLPTLIYYIVFRYLPMIGAFIIAFKKYDIYTGILASPWAGFKYFQQFFSSVFLWRLIRNTLAINIYALVFSFPAPIIFALLLNEFRAGAFKRIVQTVSYLPYFISIVVIASMVITFLSPSFGAANQLLVWLGMKKVNFLFEPKYFWSIYTIVDIWHNTGFFTIIYLAALTGIDPGLYEAAVMDGASRWRQTWHITLACISPTIIVMLLMRLGHMLEVGYETILLLYNPLLYDTADVIGTYVFRRGIVEADYSFATAVGLFQAVLGLLLIVIANNLSKRFSETSLW